MTKIYRNPSTIPRYAFCNGCASWTDQGYAAAANIGPLFATHSIPLIMMVTGFICKRCNMFLDIKVTKSYLYINDNMKLARTFAEQKDTIPYKAKYSRNEFTL